MKRIEKVFLILLTIIAVQSVAVANANATESTIARLDADLDGQVSLKEAVSDTQLLRKFARLDNNKDGKLSKQELSGDEFVAQATAKP
ncbi:calcium-binding protein [Salinimonas marina]|uniref:Calcium-binding protein n=1 Tax=Salinimonas marina TaxID=2785918 RepID=A0A7S9DW01_9ALTE|nr:calcium-binding protein [Salinimonas marina]QPG04788.1 calcium-binding protein [Salinimonas marina]